MGRASFKSLAKRGQNQMWLESGGGKFEML